MKTNTYKILLVLLSIFLFGSGNILAQNDNLFQVTDLQIKQYVEEVYQHEAQMVYNDPQRMSDIEDLLKNRIQIVPRNQIREEKLVNIKDLSSISLNKANNNSLQRDGAFNLKDFNPLKYDLDFYPIGRKLYTIGDKYILSVKPQRRAASY